METKEKRALRELERTLKIIEAYEEFEAIVECTMDKVGWDNSSIKNAYVNLRDRLKKIG